MEEYLLQARKSKLSLPWGLMNSYFHCFTLYIHQSLFLVAVTNIQHIHKGQSLFRVSVRECRWKKQCKWQFCQTKHSNSLVSYFLTLKNPGTVRQKPQLAEEHIEKSGHTRGPAIQDPSTNTEVGLCFGHSSEKQAKIS